MTWCLVFTEARREPFVQLLLSKTHHEIYHPLVRERGGRKRPMFPNYLFCRLIDGRFWDIRWTPHVLNVILDRQAQLEAVVSDLRRRERGGYVRLPRASRLQRGQEVRIISGTFEGHIGWYEGQSGHDCVRVLLDMLGRKVPVELAERDLAGISPPPHIAVRR